MTNERYQQNSHKWLTWPPLTVGLPVTSERYWAVPRLFHNATVSQCDHFFCCYIWPCICCLKLHQADYQVGEFFFLPQFWWEALSSNVFTICAVYWSLGRRGYFGVSNVVLVFSKVRVGAKEGGSHYWEMAVAITCGYGGYLLPLPAAHSSYCWNSKVVTLSHSVI